MTGKILKITSNDLYGNVDDRNVVVFACFEHTKYMNNYVIFAFENEYGKKKLGYGSLHLKYDSLVIFSIKEDAKKYIDEFILEYTCDKLENFKLLDITSINKAELVSYNEMDYDNLMMLDEKSIIRKKTEEIEEKTKKPIILYLLIFILTLCAIGLTILYLYPEKFTSEYIMLECETKNYDREIGIYYDINKTIKFNIDNKTESIDVVKEYTFLDSNKYYDFKDNNKQYQYFTNGEAFKYIDESLQLRIMYQEESVIDQYEEMYVYMNKEGYNCEEKKYEK